LEDLHPSGGKNVLNMCDPFEDDYKKFVLGELTELWELLLIGRVRMTYKADESKARFRGHLHKHQLPWF